MSASAFADIGWSLSFLDDRQRVVGDLITADAFALGRIWHSALHGTRPPHTDPATPDRVLTVLILEGTGTYTVDGVSLPFSPGDLLLHDPETATAFAAEVPVASVLFCHWAAGVLPESIRPEDLPLLLEPSPPFAALFTSIVNASIEGRLDPDDLGVAAWVDVVAASVSVLIETARRDDAPLGPDPFPTLYERAVTKIRSSFDDPQFDIAALADVLGVSRAWLHRSFAEHGTTPARALRNQRIAHARSLLPQLPTPSEIAAAAAACGFSSGRALRAALRTESRTKPMPAAPPSF